MKFVGRLSAFCFLAAVSAWSVSADAQTIRAYGETDTSVTSGGAEGQVRTHIPGAPLPQASTQAQTGTSDAESEDSGKVGSAPLTSHQITLYQSERRRTTSSEAARYRTMDSHELYKGVIPGHRNTIPHLEKARTDGQRASAPNQLTWIGFVPKENQTRVFVQGARAPQYEISRGSEGNTLVLTMRNARLPKKNFSRFIDTRFFGRTVTMIHAGQKKGDVQIRIDLRENAEPTITREGDYLFLDFAHTPTTAEATPSR